MSRSPARFMLDAVGIAREVGGQKLQGHLAPEPQLAGEPHLAHAPHANQGDDFVRAKARTGLQGHVAAAHYVLRSGGSIGALQLSSTHVRLSGSGRRPGCGALSGSNIQLSKSRGMLSGPFHYQEWASVRDRRP
jgi:hypothetical protein